MRESRARGDGGGSQSDERASLEALVEKVVGTTCEVSNVLGAGFLEKIYERALMEELKIRGVRVRAQVPYRPLPAQASCTEVTLMPASASLLNTLAIAPGRSLPE
jgi:PD-(D/E)XK nuclease superfamily